MGYNGNQHRFRLQRLAPAHGAGVDRYATGLLLANQPVKLGSIHLQGLGILGRLWMKCVLAINDLGH